MQVIKNFAHSEKAVASGLCIIGATVLAITGQITPQEWMDYSKYILAIYVGGKSIQGVAQAFSKKKRDPA